MQGDMLAELRDIHLPDPIGWWPPAPGWWILACLLAVALYFLWRFVQKHRQKVKTHYREDALQELEIIVAQYKAEGDSAAYVQQVSALLKRVSLQCYPTEKIASLSGDSWAEFLANEAGSTPHVEACSVFANVHKKRVPMDAGALYRFAYGWIEQREEL